MESLSFRERLILKLRYGLGERNYTQRQIAAILRTSIGRVRYIEAKAKQKQQLLEATAREAGGSE